MFVILPFEKEFYARFNVEVDYAGHPLMDELADEKTIGKNQFYSKNKLDPRPVIAVLPGSRIQEIGKMLPTMLELIDDFSDYQFVIAGMSSLPSSVYPENIKIIFDQTHELLRHADAALVTSGTATLETALLDTPQVVAYKTSPLTYTIGKLLVHIRFFSLVNLIMGKEIITELLQKKFTKENLSRELRKILFDTSERQKILNEYKNLKIKLGQSGVSDRIAVLILNSLNHPA